MEKIKNKRDINKIINKLNINNYDDKNIINYKSKYYYRQNVKTNAFENTKNNLN